MGDSPLVPVSKIADIVLGGTPKRSEEAYWGGKIKWASAKDITSVNTRYIYDTEERITELGLKESNTKLLPKDTIVITARGTVGAIAMLSEAMAFNQSCYGLISKDGIDPDYLFYALKASLSKISSVSYGTVFDTITMKSFDSIEIPIPSLEEQKRIAHILGTLDDKIELNQRMNETLEAIARAIFKSWFVDFDPVRAKMAGEPYPLPDEVMALFPDELVESELGLIPKGWEVKKLDQVANVVDCLHSKKPPKISRGKILFQVYNIGKQGKIDLSEKYLISVEDYKNWIRRFEASSYDIVISKTGRVGAVAQIPKGIKVALGRNLVGIRAKKDLINETFLRDLMLSQFMEDEIYRKTSSGTILRSIHVKHISKLRLIRPNKYLLDIYQSILNPFHDQINLNVTENEILSMKRENLMLLFFSGK